MCPVAVDFNKKQAVLNVGDQWVPTDVSFNADGDAAVWNGKEWELVHQHPADKTEVLSFMEAASEGYKQSATSMLLNGVQPAIDADGLSFAQTLAYQTGTVVGDLPFMVAGGAAGGAVGGVAGVPTGPGAAVTAVAGAGAGAMALPTMVKTSILQAYERGNQTAGEAIVGAITGLPEVLFAGAKAGAEGAAAAVTGGAAKAAVAGAFKAGGTTTARYAPMVAEQAAQALSFGTTAALMDQRIPTANDIGAGIVMGLGMSAATGAASDIARTKQLKQYKALKKAWLEADVDPRTTKAAAEDPYIDAEIGAMNRLVPVEMKQYETAGAAEGGAKPSRNDIEFMEMTTAQQLMKDYVDQYYPIRAFVPEGAVVDSDPYFLRVALRNRVDFVANEVVDTGRVVDTNGKDFRTVAPISYIYNDNKFAPETRAKLSEAVIKSRWVEMAAKRPDIELPEGFDVKLAAEEVMEATKRQPEIKKAMQDIYENAAAMLDLQEREGLIDAETKARISEANEMYVPFKSASDFSRQIAGRGYYGRGLKRFTGDMEALIDPLDTFAYMWKSTMQRVHNNKANTVLIDSLLESGNAKRKRIAPPRLAFDEKTGKTIVIDPSPLPKETELDIYRAGKRERYELPRDVIEAVQAGFDSKDYNVVMRLAQTASKVSRLGTVADVGFMGVMVLYDQTQAAFTVPGYVPFVDMIRGLTQTKRMGSAARRAGIYGVLDRHYNELLQTEVSTYNTRGIKLDIVDRKPWNLVENINDAADTVGRPLGYAMRTLSNATRMRSFVKWEDYLRKSRPSLSAEQVTEQAALLARKSTLDTQQVGAAMHGYISLSKFMNAAVQAPFQIGSALKKTPPSQVALATATMISGTTALWVANKLAGTDASEEERRRYWLVPVTDYTVRIPKVPVFGVIANATEAMLDVMFADKEITTDDLLKVLGISDAGSFGVSMFLPDAIEPAFSVMYNQNYFFNSPVVPRYLEQEKGKYQISPKTTMLAKKLAAALPGDASPMKVDALLQGYLGSNVLRSVSGILEGQLWLPPIDRKGAETQMQTFMKLPTVDRFIRRDTDEAFAASLEAAYYFNDEPATLVHQYRSAAKHAAFAEEVLTPAKERDAYIATRVADQQQLERFFADPVVQQSYTTLKKYSQLSSQVLAAVRNVQDLPADAVFNRGVAEDVYNMTGEKLQVGPEVNKQEFTDGLILVMIKGLEDADKARNDFKRMVREYKIK